MKHFLYGALALCFALASCGDGGGSVESVPVIKFVGTYDFACGNCSPPRENSLTIAPVTGATGLGSRDIARVELSVEHGPVQVLTSPNSKNATGQATYVFFFPRTSPIVPNLARVCTPPIALEITVTDVAGFAFKKYYNACNAGEFGAFSDYGDRTVTYRAVTTAPMRASFARLGAGGYLDGGSNAAGVTASTWTLKARDGDALGAGWIYDASIADGAVTTVSIEGEGGALASSAVAKGSTADTFLVCCGFGAAAQSPPSSASTRTVSFVVNPVQYGVDVTKALRKFNVYYRIYDPGTGTVVAEFQGAGDGYTVWSFPVKAGYEMKLEASPQSAVTDVQVYISNGSAQLFSGNSLGFANSNRPDVPAKLKVFCCAR